jgi:hypothetical protein
MLAGSLNFTLGLQANQFINSLGIAGGRLLAFTGIATGLNAAFNKMWQAIEKGGALKDLAAAANLSVKDLYKLQRGFKEVGASADSVPAVLNRLRRTLAGGEQNGLLAQLGLDPAALAQMDPAAQFEKVAAALAKLNVNARAGAAFKLFGREGATVIQQIANSGNDFAEAMQRASSDANIWQQVSGAFDAISDKMNEVQARIETMWALLAGALIQAFAEGKLAETLFDIFSSVFQALGAALPGLLAGGLVKIGATLLQVLSVPLTYLQTTLDAAVQGLFVVISKIPGLRDAAGIPANFQAESWGEMFARNKEQGTNFFGASFSDMDQYAADAIKNGLGAGQGIMEALGGRLGELVGRLPQSTTTAAGTSSAGISGGKVNNPQVTSLERMGAILNGRGSMTTDSARRTADNTRAMLAEQKKTNQLLAGKKDSGYENID